MIKNRELADPKSCLNQALDNEPVFVLRGKDICSPAAILFWCRHRVSMGKNQKTDTQISSAQDMAETMLKYQERLEAK